MHDCLQIPEILTIIFQNCLSRSPDGMRDGTNVLTVLARTSKAFHESSIQILWEELPSLHVLIGQFPENTFSWDDQRRFYAFKTPRAMKSLPISKIQRYCSHVRILEYNPDWRLHHSVLLALYDSARDKAFFPKLEQAVFPCILHRPMETILYPALLVSSRLQRISFVTNAIYHLGDPSIEGPIAMDDQAREALDKRVEPIAKQFTTFMPSYHLGAFPMGLKQYTWTPAILDLVSHLSDSFTTFNAGHAYVELPALQGLTRLSNLTTLSLTVQPPHLMAASSHSFQFTFPALTTLNIAFTVYPMNPFFERVAAPALENLRIEVWDEREGEIVLQGLHEDANGQQQTGVANIPTRYVLLKSLTIRVHDLVTEDVPLYFSLQPSGLATFSELKHLESVCIAPCTVSALMDEHLFEAFQKWPKLKKFALHEDPFWAGVTQTDLTLGGLRAALEYCPHVSELVLACDARQIPTFLAPPIPIPPILGFLQLTNRFRA
ncbi:hypothetical protein BKA70DRAFT_829444 [Coprinopsis sp. MPI-PUGE-AT-0042]|nr:hypothetical protein BKA70DRAFT_829444 [Coprinopsis sp. MPI-PUGE-AT-0042]